LDYYRFRIGINYIFIKRSQTVKNDFNDDNKQVTNILLITDKIIVYLLHNL